MLDHPTALLALIVAIVALSFWLEGRFAGLRVLGAPLLAIVFGALLSNAGLVPAESKVYQVISGPLVSLAIVWLLLSLRLDRLRATGPRMLQAFGLAVFATAVGAVVAVVAFGRELGAETWKLGGVMTGTYSGGSLNFVAVERAVELSPSMFAAATAADNVATGLWVGMSLVLPVWLAAYYPKRKLEAPGASANERPPESEMMLGRLSPMDALSLLLVGLAVVLAASWLGSLFPAVPEVLFLTTLALCVGFLPWARNLNGGFALGYIALHLFFVVIGISSRLSEIRVVGWSILWFTLTVVAIHGLVLYLLGRVMKLDVETLSVASQAAIGGPPTAMALASSRGWRDLVVPGLAVGILGYAVGTYAGLAVAYLLKAAIG